MVLRPLTIRNTTKIPLEGSGRSESAPAPNAYMSTALIEIVESLSGGTFIHVNSIPQWYSNTYLCNCVTNSIL
jgi:hypothetical protein